MRVLHVISRLDVESGGHSRSVPQQIAVSNRMGVQADIVAEHKSAPLIGEAGLVRRAGGKVIIFPKVGLKDMFWAQGSVGTRLGSIMKGYDLVHINGVWSPICHLGVTIALRLAKPVVISPHGMLQPWPLRQKGLKKLIARWVYQDRDVRSAMVLRSTSQDEARQLRLLYGEVPIAIITNGVSYPARLKRAKTKRNRRAVFLARFHPKKGLSDLVNAVAILQEKLRRDRWLFIVAGYGGDKHVADMRRLAARGKVDDLFSYVGRVEGSAKWRLLCSADLFILPTYGENFGLVVAEALISGVPVITTRATPWSDLQSWRCGWWIPVGASALGKTLTRATSLPLPALRRMGERGKILVIKKYSWEGVTHRLFALYKWMLGFADRPTTVSMPGPRIGRE